VRSVASLNNFGGGGPGAGEDHLKRPLMTFAAACSGARGAEA